jgi:hypothetical protein
MGASLRRLVLAVAAAAFLSGPAAADTRPKAPAPAGAEEAFYLTLGEAGAALSNEDIDHGRALLLQAWRSPGFAAAPAQVRHDLLLAINELSLQAKAWPDAQAAARALTEAPGATGDDWRARSRSSARAGDKADAIASLATVAERFPKSLSDLSDETIYYWLNEARRQPEGEAVNFRLADAVFKGAWTPKDPFIDLSDIRRAYVLGLLSRGRQADAEREAARITDGGALMSIRADKRFDALKGSGSQRFSIKAAARARLDAVDALLKTHPQFLAGPNAKAEILIALNRADEALAVIDAALAKTATGADAFEDQAEKLAWAHNTRQIALNRLGRRDEALDALAAGARVPDNGRPNVSQTLNLAVAQVQAGQAKAALTTVASVRLDLMSPYGRAVMLKAKTCAAAALGDAPLAQAARRELEALGDASRGASLDALLCTGDLDAAAKLMIARLADPANREPVLLELQITPPARYPTAYGTTREARVEQLRQRPDVLAALEPVGRIVRYAPEDLW